MRVSVLFTYHDSPEGPEIAAKHEVDIAEVDFAQAPVALRAHSLVLGDQDFRYYAGRLWVPQVVGSGGDPRLGAVQLPYRRERTREQAIQQAEQWAAEQLLIEDELWGATAAPCYAVLVAEPVEEDEAAFARRVELTDLRFGPGGLPAQRLFAVSELDAALEAARALARELGLQGLEVEQPYTQFDVLIPEALGLKAHNGTWVGADGLRLKRRSA